MTRVKKCMASELGELAWRRFEVFAIRHYKQQFLDFFSGTVACCGQTSGEPCPSGFVVHFNDPAHALQNMNMLHLDHEFNLRRICDVWKEARSAATPVSTHVSWDHGIDRVTICQLLFGVRNSKSLLSKGSAFWRACLVPRCGAARGRGGGPQFCHNTDVSHVNLSFLTADDVCSKDEHDLTRVDPSMPTHLHVVVYSGLSMAVNVSFQQLQSGSRVSSIRRVDISM